MRQTSLTAPPEEVEGGFDEDSHLNIFNSLSVFISDFVFNSNHSFLVSHPYVLTTKTAGSDDIDTSANLATITKGVFENRRFPRCGIAIRAAWILTFTFIRHY